MLPRPLRFAARWTALIACCLLARAARADDRVPAVSNTQIRTEVAFFLPIHAGLDRHDLELAAARLRELPVDVTSSVEDTSTLASSIQTARSVARRGNVLAVLWLGRWHAERTLFLHDPRSDHTLARKLPRGPNATADREELAIVVNAMIGALLEGLALEMEEVETPRATAAPPRSDAAVGPPDWRAEIARSPETKVQRTEPTDAGTTPSAPSGAGQHTAPAFAWAVRAGYLGMTRTIDVGTGWDSGASLGARFWSGAGLHADIAYGFVPATTVSIGGATASFSRHPATLAAGWSLLEPARPWRWLSAELVLGVDRVSRTTSSPGDGLEATPDEARWLLAAGARVGAAARLTAGISLYALLGGDAVLNPVHYVIDSGDSDVRFGLNAVGARTELGIALDIGRASQ